MEGPEAGGTVSPEEDFSFVSPIVKFVLFFFNMLFWVISMVMVAVGVYAWLLKHAEATMACLVVDPAILLIVVGVLTFLIAFCGCIGSLRENIVLLQVVSPWARGDLPWATPQDWGHFAVVLPGHHTPLARSSPSAWPSSSSCSWSLACWALSSLIRHAGRSVRSSMVPSCTTGMTWTCRTSLTSGRRSSAAVGVSPTRTGPRTCTSTAPWTTPAGSAAPSPSPAACRMTTRLSSTPCVDMAYRPWATWRPALSSTPMAASTAWSTGSTGTSSCWGALRWGWQPHSWWASCWLRSSSTRSETRSSCSSTTSSTGQTPCTDPGASQRLSPPGLPNPGSIGRAEGTLLEKRKVGAVDAGSVHCGHTWLGRSKLPCAVWGTKLLSVCLSWGTPSWCADCA
ncbi:tetraspanin-33 isoform X2 [Lathamus discolor]|uniref:tetraspanin-33 isoform X2 n=1 Tax=Lathamus discolor TaxID=678569 RepID=UPI0032B71C04